MTTVEQAGRAIVFILGTLALGPATAAAQPAIPSRLSAGVATGLAIPLHADFGFNALEWQISIRAAVSDHFVLEGFFDEWRKSTEEAFQIVPSRVSTRTVHSTRAVGFNGLLRTTIGRATITAGGGPGFLVYRRDYFQTSSGCQATTAEECFGAPNRWTSGSFSVQGVAAVDVAIVSRLSAFAQYQVMTPINDPGGSHMGIVAGVRVGVF